MMEINCSFGDHSLKTGEKVYKCLISFPKPTSKDENFKLITSHSPGKSDTDVAFVEVRGCYCKVPQGLTKYFPNMRFLGIYYTRFSTICKDDKAEYKNLEGFICQNNNIFFLPRDLFDGFENLKFIDFYRNKLKIIEPNILDGLDKLEFVDFSKNRNYFKDFSNDPYFYSCVTLSGMKNYLFERFFTLDEQIVMKYMENYPDKLNLLKILNQQVEDINTSFKKYELTYAHGHQQQVTQKIEKLEILNSELFRKVENLNESNSKIQDQIKTIKAEHDNENDKMMEFMKNLQTQIDNLTRQV